MKFAKIGITKSYIMKYFWLLSILIILSASTNAVADDPLEYKTGTEEWDREEELKKQVLIEAQRKKMALDDFQNTKTRFSNQLYEWQKELSRFQEIKRTIADILFQEEARSYQQVNVKDRLPRKEIKSIPAKNPDVTIETGGPIIEKRPAQAPPISPQNPSPQVNTPPVPVQVPTKKEEPPEPTPEEILKKQKGHFDDKGQFIDEELKQESREKSSKEKDIDYDNP